MKKRLISILLALCMVLALVPGTAGASIDDESYSYKTTITTSNVTVGRDNYSCDVSMTTGEIMPHICKVVDNRLQKFAVLHDGDAITVYPNKYGATSNGKYIYIDASVGSGYVYEKYIVFKDENPPSTSDSELPAPVISLTTGSSIQAGSSCGVRWNPVKGATYYLYNILDVGNQIYSRLDAICYGTETENLLWSTPGTYSIWVQAVDSSGNRSGRSNVVTLTVTGQSSNPDGDTSSQLNQDEVFIKQPPNSKACLLCASTIMLRRRAIVDGDENWGNITSDSVKKKALSGGNLLWTFQYASDFETMNVAHKSLAGTAQSKKDELIRLLQEHPEGIVIYDRGRPHGVLLTDYDGDIFYCGDSSNGAAKGRIPLTDSTMILSWSGGDLAAKQDQIIANIDDIWYIKMSSITAKVTASTKISGSCPIEMLATVCGETLDSRGTTGTVSNNYATMTAEGAGQNRHVSIQINGNYALNGNANVHIFGTDSGEMTLTVTHQYEDSSSETYIFQNVPLTETTIGVIDSLNLQTTTVLTMTDTAIGEKNLWAVNPDEVAVAPTPDFEFINEDDGESSGASDAYYIHTPAPQNGTLTVSKHTAAPGDWVNIYATPNAGYRLDSLTATDHRGWPVTVREMGENAFSFTMPAARVTVNAVFTKAVEDVPFPTEDSSATGPDTAAGSPGYVDVILNPSPMNFTDVSAADWFYNDVRFCWQHYLMTGVSETRFDPQGATNRAMIWTMIARLAGRDTSGGSIWYERGQIWAKNKGITDGADPLADVTREQLVTMLWRFKGSPHVNTGNLLQFKDAAEVSGWAVQPVRWAAANGLLNGAFGSLNPQGKATRAEVAAILTRFCQFAG